MPFLMQLTLSLFALSLCVSGAVLHYQTTRDETVRFHTLLAPYGISALILLAWAL